MTVSSETKTFQLGRELTKTHYVKGEKKQQDSLKEKCTKTQDVLRRGETLHPARKLDKSGSKQFIMASGIL